MITKNNQPMKNLKIFRYFMKLVIKLEIVEYKRIENYC